MYVLVHFSPSVCSCILPRQTEDKCSFCLLLSSVSNVLICQMKDKSCLLASCELRLPLWQNAAAVGYFTQPYQHLETEHFSHLPRVTLTSCCCSDALSWHNRSSFVENFSFFFSHSLLFSFLPSLCIRAACFCCITNVLSVLFLSVTHLSQSFFLSLPPQAVQ